jgi:hypothetical protein
MSSLLPENFFAVKDRLKGFMLEFRGGSNFRDTEAYNTMLGMDTRALAELPEAAFVKVQKRQS